MPFWICGSLDDHTLAQHSRDDDLLKRLPTRSRMQQREALIWTLQYRLPKCQTWLLTEANLDPVEKNDRMETLIEEIFRTKATASKYTLLQKLLEKQPSIDGTFKLKQSTLFFAACYYGAIELVLYLAKKTEKLVEPTFTFTDGVRTVGSVSAVQQLIQLSDSRLNPVVDRLIESSVGLDAQAADGSLLLCHLLRRRMYDQLGRISSGGSPRNWSTHNFADCPHCHSAITRDFRIGTVTEVSTLITILPDDEYLTRLLTATVTTGRFDLFETLANNRALSLVTIYAVARGVSVSDRAKIEKLVRGLGGTLPSIDTDSEPLCLVCWRPNKEPMMFEPCHHVACCRSCALRVTDCPLRCGKIEKRTRVYPVSVSSDR